MWFILMYLLFSVCVLLRNALFEKGYYHFCECFLIVSLTSFCMWPFNSVKWRDGGGTVIKYFKSCSPASTKRVGKNISTLNFSLCAVTPVFSSFVGGAKAARNFTEQNLQRKYKAANDWCVKMPHCNKRSIRSSNMETLLWVEYRICRKNCFCF